MTGTTNYDRLLKDERPEPKTRKGKAWTEAGIPVSVMTREDAGVDGDEPWIASCDKHHEMLACPTKRSAIDACRDRDWCSGCRQEAR